MYICHQRVSASPKHRHCVEPPPSVAVFTVKDSSNNPITVAGFKWENLRVQFSAKGFNDTNINGDKVQLSLKGDFNKRVDQWSADIMKLKDDKEDDKAAMDALNSYAENAK